jgi:tetratricopeptide (TPR) repeat protein
MGMLLLSSVAWGQSADLNRIRNDIRRLDTRIRLLARSYRTFNPNFTVSLAKRVSDGKLNFLLKDYTRASINLFDAVENPRNKGRAQWYEAMYLLAEALFKSRNYEGSGRYYKRLVGLNRTYVARSLVRLVQIAEKTKRYAWLNRYFQQAKSLPSSPIRNQLFYLSGKGLYQQKRFSDAKRALEQIPVNSDFWARAQYFLAVITLENPSNGNISAATGRLLRILKRASRPTSTDERKVRDTILIAIARLYHQRGLISRALLYYQRLDRNSHVFAQALYEICQAYLRRSEQVKTAIERKKFNQKALNQLELLLAFLPDTPFVPRVKLLRGDLLLQLEKFPKAMKNYESLVSRYSNVYAYMNNFSRRHSDPKAFFRNLISRDLQKFDLAQYLPKDAVNWISSEELMSRALRLTNDLRTMKQNIKDSRKIIRRLEKALQIKDKIALSPSLKEGRARAQDIRRKLISLEARLNAAEKNIVFSKMTSAERRRYMEIRRRLSAVRALFQQAPKSRTDSKKRNNSVKKRLASMMSRLRNVGNKLVYSRRMLRSVRNWLLNNPKARKLTPEQRNSLRTDANQLERLNDTLTAERERLINLIDLARIQLEYSGMGSQEQKVQKTYRSLLRQEKQLFQSLSSRLSSSERQSVSDIRRYRTDIRSTRLEVTTFLNRLRTQAEKNARLIQLQVSREKGNVNRYNLATLRLQDNAKDLIAQIAYRSFASTQQKFYKLILQADVGVIDVAWQRKRSTQDQIDKIGVQQGKALRQLRLEFKDLLKEVQ